MLVCLYLLSGLGVPLGGGGRKLHTLNAAAPRGKAADLNRDMDAALVAAAGGGMGMAKHTEERRVHVSKYLQTESVALDPWDAALQAAAERSAPNDTTTRRATVDPFARGAEALKKRGGLKRRPISADADANDPQTFGFVEIGTVVGSHGIRGMMRVDTVSDFGDVRFCEAGLRHMKLPNRRSPRCVVLKEGRRLKVMGAKTRYIIKLDGVGSREAAQALAGATLWVVEDERAPDEEEDDDGYYLQDDLFGATAYDADSDEVLGTVVDVIDAPRLEDGSSLGHSTLEIELASRPRYRCLVPLADPIVPRVDVDKAAVYMRPPDGLFDLAYEFKPPAPFIRAFLPPPADDDDDASSSSEKTEEEEEEEEAPRKNNNSDK